MPYQCFAGFHLFRGGHLLFKSLISLLDSALELAIFLFLIYLLKILALDLLFKPGYSHFLTLELPLSLLYLLLSFSNLAQVPLNNLQTIFVYLGILYSASKITDVKIISSCTTQKVVGCGIMALKYTDVG